MSKLKVLIADAISHRGVEALAEGGLLDVDVRTGLSEDELIEIIPQYSGMVVRSQTKVTASVLEAAKLLKVVGRAGVGTDNVDIKAATMRGVIVMNTPGGNTISTAEHAFSLLVSTARSIPQAHASIVGGRWDRKKFEGVELYGKTLGILGMGRIGSEIAQRAIAFGMRVLAYDPYLSEAKAQSLHVELVEDVESVLSRADFITLHMPLTAETKHILDARRLALCKKNVRIVNCARGGLIDEAALADALKSGHVAAAALDVYEVEPPPADFPLRDLPNIVFTPHLGASTAEAQENVGIEIAAAIRAALLDGEVRNAVNMPSVDAKTAVILTPFITLGAKLGRFVGQLAAKRNDLIQITYGGKAAAMPAEAITRAILTGFLKHVGGEEVNVVNCFSMIESLGLKVKEVKSSEEADYNEWLQVSVSGAGETVSVGGTFFGARNEPRIVRVNNQSVEVIPEGVVLMMNNQDIPGIIGQVGTCLGEYKLNIAAMSLSRDLEGGKALTLFNLDSTPCEAALAVLRNIPSIGEVKVIEL